MIEERRAKSTKKISKEDLVKGNSRLTHGVCQRIIKCIDCKRWY